MYKAYLKRKTKNGSEVIKESMTTTPNPLAAEIAYRELLNRVDLIGQNIHAVLSLNSKNLMYHRFDRNPGESDYISPDAPIDLGY